LNILRNEKEEGRRRMVDQIIEKEIEK